jgi:hypothetical protein
MITKPWIYIIPIGREDDLIKKCNPLLKRLSNCLLAFRKRSIPEKTVDSAVNLEEETADFAGIRCPLCQWQPQSSSRWYCADCGHPEYFSGGCGTVWNTFTTRGLCPGCGHQWRYTACLRCHGWSLHEAWYTGQKG